MNFLVLLFCISFSYILVVLASCYSYKNPKLLNDTLLSFILPHVLIKLILFSIISKEVFNFLLPILLIEIFGTIIVFKFTKYTLHKLEVVQNKINLKYIAIFLLVICLIVGAAIIINLHHNTIVFLNICFVIATITVLLATKHLQTRSITIGIVYVIIHTTIIAGTYALQATLWLANYSV